MKTLALWARSEFSGFAIWTIYCLLSGVRCQVSGVRCQVSEGHPLSAETRRESLKFGRCLVFYIVTETEPRVVQYLFLLNLTPDTW